HRHGLRHDNRSVRPAVPDRLRIEAPPDLTRARVAARRRGRRNTPDGVLRRPRPFAVGGSAHRPKYSVLWKYDGAVGKMETLDRNPGRAFRTIRPLLQEGNRSVAVGLDGVGAGQSQALVALRDGGVPPAARAESDVVVILRQNRLGIAVPGGLGHRGDELARQIIENAVAHRSALSGDEVIRPARTNLDADRPRGRWKPSDRGGRGLFRAWGRELRS